MELPVNPFKRALAAGRQQIGLWCCSAAMAVEVVAGSGFDWLLLDMEHSPNELAMVLAQLQAAAAIRRMRWCGRPGTTWCSSSGFWISARRRW